MRLSPRRLPRPLPARIKALLLSFRAMIHFTSYTIQLSRYEKRSLAMRVRDSMLKRVQRPNFELRLFFLIANSLRFLTARCRNPEANRSRFRNASFVEDDGCCSIGHGQWPCIGAGHREGHTASYTSRPNHCIDRRSYRGDEAFQFGCTSHAM